MSDVIGDKQLRAVLDELGPRIERTVTRGAMGAAGMPIVKAARKNARARKVTGGLAKSAGKRVKTYTRNGVVFVAAGYLWKKGGYHSHLVEFGHRLGKQGGSLSWRLKNIATDWKRFSKRTVISGRGGDKKKAKAAEAYLSGNAKAYEKLAAAEAKLTKRQKKELVNASLWQRGKAFASRAISHVRGRVPGYPILAPAFRETSAEALRIAFTEHQKRVEKEAAKLAAEKGALT